MCLSPEAGAVNTNGLLVMAALGYLSRSEATRSNISRLPCINKPNRESAVIVFIYQYNRGFISFFPLGTLRFIKDGFS
ncbi:unnamed protein product [Bubo scandiacus]